MSKKIDHDEDDRDSSDYEPIDEEVEEEVEEVEEEEVQEFTETIIYEKEVESEQQFQQEYITEQIPTTINGIPDSMKIDYEEVYPHNAGSSENPHEMEEAEKVYYENEMEDLVYHEIYGEGSEQKLGNDKRIRNIIGSTASCIVCQRTESEKIRLFKWPKSEELREQWLHFFRIPQRVLNSHHEPYICCYHFSSDTFVMMDDRIFWKMTALPKYRQRRPGLTEPFPWEPNAKKLDHQMMNQPSTSTQTLGYRIRYRMPYSKHKSRTAHQVAVMTPVSQPHLFYEFHFNRYGLNNTKFYACLNCRKAKTESGIRDVIRTIHLDGFKFLSSGDPFNGHHFACRPHNVYDLKSAWRPIPGQSNELNVFQNVVYVDDNSGESVEWHSVTRPDDENPEEVVHSKEGEPPLILYDNFENPISEEIIETEYVIDDPPAEVPASEYPELEPEPEPEPEPETEMELDLNPENEKFQEKTSKKPRIKCHLCSKSNFPSTRSFVNHLQKHIVEEKSCKKCQKKVSCDSRAMCIRKGICEDCLV
uniref:THAP-type domain-containing protein n=1 Tax=Caenorhabditis tropicalis TaxID=1561998 RepID=A0A1I7TB38_9PELO